MKPTLDIILFVAALILFFLFRPNQFLSLLGRAFTPFGSGAIARQTTLNVLQPTGVVDLGKSIIEGHAVTGKQFTFAPPAAPTVKAGGE